MGSPQRIKGELRFLAYERLLPDVVARSHGMPGWCRRWLVSVGLAVVLLAALAGGITALEPDRPWLVRLACRDEATLQRLLGTGMRALLWERGQVYGLATAEQRARVAALGIASEILSRQAAEGDYFVVYASAPEAQSLGQRYGPLVPLGDGFYLLGLAPGASPLEPVGPRFVRRLPFSIELLPGIPPPPAPPLSTADMTSLVEGVTPARLAQTIAQLQDDDDRPGPDALRSRFTMVPGLAAEGAYLAQQLQAMGLSVSHLPFTATDHGLQVSRPVSNIVAALPGVRPDSEGFYIVCAHYDSTASREAGWRDQWPNAPAPGADDNASGAAAVLEVARALAGHRFAYSVRFVLFAGEEQGLQGSHAYATALRAVNARVLGVINLDMVAYDANGDGQVELHAGSRGDSQALASALARNMARYAPSLHPELKTDTATTRSDHASFWASGYPAVLLIEDWEEFTPHYHTYGDSLATLNIPYYADIVRATVATIGELAQPWEPDLSASRMAAALDMPFLTTVAYTITIRNSSALTATATLTDALAPELALASPISVTSGISTWDPTTRAVGWSGAVAPQAAVTMTFRALLDPREAAGAWIRNTAVLDDGAGRVYELPAHVRVPWRWRLPSVLH